MATEIRLIVDDSRDPNGVGNEVDRIRRAIHELQLSYTDSIVFLCDRQVEVEVATITLEVEATRSAESVEETVLDLGFLNLNLSTRTSNVLTDRYNRYEDINIKTIGDLIKYSAKDLLSMEGIGAKGIHEIRVALAKHNLHLMLEGVYTEGQSDADES